MGCNTTLHTGAHPVQHLFYSFSLYIGIHQMGRSLPPSTAEIQCTWDRSSKTFVRAGSQRQPTKFLKGPVPWSWIQSAACLPAKSLHVGLCLWRLAGATHSMTIKLSNQEVAALGIDRHAKSRALQHLERAGLVKVDHHRGRFPRVTILSKHSPQYGEVRKPPLTECGY